MIDGESRRKFHKLRLDAFSFPHYVIKKVHPHGARHGNTEEQKEYHMLSTRGKDGAKELTLKKNITREFTIVFKETQAYRDSQLIIGWTEQKCIEMDRKITRTVYPKRNSRDTKDNGISH